MFVTGEKGDTDFFHFTSKEAQFIKFDVSGIPGVDISAGVYEKSMLFPPVGEEGPLPSDLPEIPKEEIPNGEVPPGEEIPQPIPKICHRYIQVIVAELGKVKHLLSKQNQIKSII